MKLCGTLFVVLLLAGCATKQDVQEIKTKLEQTASAINSNNQILQQDQENTRKGILAVEERLQNRFTSLEESKGNYRETLEQTVCQTLAGVPTGEHLKSLIKTGVKEACQEIQQEAAAAAERERYEAWKRQQAAEAERKQQTQQFQQMLHEAFGGDPKEILQGIKGVRTAVSDWRAEADKHFQAFLLELKNSGATKGYRVTEITRDSRLNPEVWKRLQGNWQQVMRPHNTMRVMCDHPGQACYVIRDQARPTPY